jgi:hypothetical protein
MLSGWEKYLGFCGMSTPSHYFSMGKRKPPMKEAIQKFRRLGNAPNIAIHKTRLAIPSIAAHFVIPLQPTLCACWLGITHTCHGSTSCLCCNCVCHEDVAHFESRYALRDVMILFTKPVHLRIQFLVDDGEKLPSQARLIQMVQSWVHLVIVQQLST